MGGKICRVLLNNELFTVVNYDGIEVQLPSIHRSADYINVEFKDNHYMVIDENKKAFVDNNKVMKYSLKKTTTKNVENPKEHLDESD